MMLSRSRRPRILFVGEAVSLAHVVRPLVLARSLDSVRFDVHFACGAHYQRFVDGFAGRYHVLPTLSPDVFGKRLRKGSPLYDGATLSAYVEAERTLFARLKPDLIIGDFRVSLSISAESSGIPYVQLCNAHWSPCSTLPFPTPELPVVRVLGARVGGALVRGLSPLVFRHHVRAFDRLRTRFGLEPLCDLREMYTRGTHTLYLDTPQLSPTRNLPTHHRYLGPVIWSPPVAIPKAWGALPEDKPLVYVSLGSSGDVTVLDRILEAVSRLPVLAVLATAGRTRLDRLPPNVRAAEYLPGDLLLKRAALCICSGGAAPSYQALGAGVPVLGFPSNADQFLHMEGVTRAGVGLYVRPSTATVTGIEETVRSMLGASRFRKAAASVRLEILAHPAEANFLDFLEANGRAPRVFGAKENKPCQHTRPLITTRPSGGTSGW